MLNLFRAARLLGGLLLGKILHLATAAAVLDAKRLRETRDASS